MIARQVRRLLKDANEDTDQLKNEIRQQIKRLISLDSQSEILNLLFHTEYLNLNTIRMFIDEILIELDKNSHHHNPQETIHVQDFCHNALNLLNIYTITEKYRTDHLFSLSQNEDLFSKEVKTHKYFIFNIFCLFFVKEFQNELNLADDEATLYYRLFEQQYSNRIDKTKKKVRFNDDDKFSDTKFSFGQFQSMFVASRHVHSTDNQLEIKPTINSEDFSLLGSYLFSSWLWLNDSENLEENFRSYLQLIHLKNDDLVLLCLYSLLSKPLILPKSIQIWKQIFSVIYSINNNKNLLKITLEKTTSALTALLLTLIFRLYDKDMKSAILIRRLSALVAIQNLYSSIKDNNEQDESIDSRLNQFTVENIFIKHRYDYLMELIGRKIVEAAIEPSWLTITSTDTVNNSFQSKIQIEFIH